MSDSNTTAVPAYKLGDIVNGHVLTEQGWIALPPAQPVQHVAGPMTSASLNVNREVSYVRQQKGHSIILHLLLGGFVLWIPTIYFAASPNHYFHV